MKLKITENIKKWFVYNNLNYINFIIEYDFNLDKIILSEIYFSDEQENAKIVNINIIGKDTFICNRPIFRPFREHNTFLSYFIKKPIKNEKIHILIFVIKNECYISVDEYFIKDIDYLTHFLNEIIKSLFQNSNLPIKIST